MTKLIFRPKRKNIFDLDKPHMVVLHPPYVFFNDSNLTVNMDNFTTSDIFGEILYLTSNTFLLIYISAISYSLSGILACFLLMRFSYRKVSFVGSILFLVGSIARIFVQNFTELAISREFIQRLGMGLLMAACLTALNSNFVKKIALMTCLHETSVYVFGMVIPLLANWGVETFGSRETLIGLFLLCCLCLPASAMLKPPPKEMIVSEEEQNENDEDEDISSPGVLSLAESKELTIPLVDRIAFKTTFSRLSEKLTLLNSYKYWNTVIGISLALNADACFFALMPVLNLRISANQKMESLLELDNYSAPELIFRIVLTIVLGFVKLNSRMMILSTSALVVVIRVVLVPFISTKSQFIIFECLKCFTQAPVPLVFSEEYKDNFTTAYCIFMVMYSVVSLIFTGSIHLALHCTDAVKKTEYMYIAAYAICVIIWTLEFTVFRKKPTNNDQNLNEDQ
ncbi:hypothetical protein ABEB36_002629 [Hypothenemus hampei]|uniref:Uncharacterized protein n=1 Tax=Hypothenemus hampei TaxID=57062 RepID=A0ABD1F868_HYPHA